MPTPAKRRISAGMRFPRKAVVRFDVSSVEELRELTSFREMAGLLYDLTCVLRNALKSRDGGMAILDRRKVRAETLEVVRDMIYREAAERGISEVLY